MIHHFSIAARDPEHVAAVLAEVIGGQSFNFSTFPGSRIVVTGDAHGTAIEVYPLGLELAPGEGFASAHSVTNAQALRLHSDACSHFRHRGRGKHQTHRLTGRLAGSKLHSHDLFSSH